MLKQGAVFILLVLLFSLPISLCIKLKSENVGSKYMLFAMKRMFMYQVMMPIMLFPVLLLVDKEKLAKMFVNDFMNPAEGVNRKELIANLAEQIDWRFLFLFTRLFIKTVNHNYNAYTKMNVEFVRKDVKQRKEQKEKESISKDDVVKKQMNFFDIDSNNGKRLIEKCYA